MNNMKNFDQFSTESQQAIKSFKENFWQTLEKYEPKVVSNFLMFNNCSKKEIAAAIIS